jgi:hypothetical protein
MSKLTRDRIIVIVWIVVFLVFIIAKDFLSAEITAGIGIALAVKELCFPTDYE